MSPEAQRVAIAEACPHLFWIYRSPIESARSLRPAIPRVYRLGEHPAEGDRECDPLNDLNAMHEAEKVLTYKQLEVMHEILAKVLSTWIPRRRRTAHDFVWHATAAQRAEAFLKTISKWDDTK